MTTEIPVGLARVRDFVNTTDSETDTDDLSTRAELTQFLSSAGLLITPAPSTAEELAFARSLRAGLRRALELNHDGASEPIASLQEMLTRLTVRLRWDGSATSLEPVDDGVMGALTELVIAVHVAVTGGTWWRLKICAADDCAWAYFDASKNRSRNWCEYGCGNKSKTRAYRARRKALSTA